MAIFWYLKCFNYTSVSSHNGLSRKYPHFYGFSVTTRDILAALFDKLENITRTFFQYCPWGSLSISISKRPQNDNFLNIHQIINWNQVIKTTMAEFLSFDTFSTFLIKASLLKSIGSPKWVFVFSPFYGLIETFYLYTHMTEFEVLNFWSKKW